jgi:hypothetical protein
VLGETSRDSPAVPVADQVAAALRGEKRGRVPAELVLAICAADDPVAYAACFEGDLAAAVDATRPQDDRIRALEHLRTALPPGTADAAARVLAEPDVSARLAQAAAGTLARSDSRRMRDLLGPGSPAPALAALARAAGTTRDLAFVDPLRALLVHPDAAVRSAAHVSVFSLVGDRYPALARLDTSAFPSRGYLDAVEDFRAFWAREGGGEPPR